MWEEKANAPFFLTYVIKVNKFNANVLLRLCYCSVVEGLLSGFVLGPEPAWGPFNIRYKLILSMMAK